MDGANELRSFLSVGLRMLAPGYVTIFLFPLAAAWNNFFLPLVMLNDTQLYPLSLGLYSWNATAPITPDYYPLMVIGSLLALLPLVIAFLLLQRFWRSGLTAGSVTWLSPTAAAEPYRAEAGFLTLVRRPVICDSRRPTIERRRPADVHQL